MWVRASCAIALASSLVVAAIACSSSDSNNGGSGGSGGAGASGGSGGGATGGSGGGGGSGGSATGGSGGAGGTGGWGGTGGAPNTKGGSVTVIAYDFNGVKGGSASAGFSDNVSGGANCTQTTDGACNIFSCTTQTADAGVDSGTPKNPAAGAITISGGSLANAVTLTPSANGAYAGQTIMGAV